MAINSILPPYPMFFDLAGKPLEGGYVYIGEAGYEARAKPKASYFDLALTVPTGTANGAAVRTSGGYPAFNGSARMIYVDGDFSITVLDRNGVLLYTALSRSLAYAIDAATVTALGLDDRLLYRGATEPSPTAAGALWFDTGTSILKRRNAANDGWISVSPETIGANSLWGNPTGAAAAMQSLTMSQLKTMLGFGQNLSGNGYATMPNGLIVQWGSATTDGSGNAVVTLPTAYTNQFSYQPIGMHIGTGFCNVIQDNSFSKSATQFRLRALTAAGAGISTVGLSWLTAGF